MGLLTDQLAARAAYKAAEAAVQQALTTREEARQAVMDADDAFQEAKRSVQRRAEERLDAARECKRLGIEQP